MRAKLKFLGASGVLPSRLLVVMLACAILPSISSATIWINNSIFGFTSTGVMTFRSGGADFIDFCPTNTGTPPTGAGACGVRNTANGDILVQPGTGNFAGLAPNTPGTILDLTDVPGATGPAPGAAYTFFPPGIPGQNIQHFLTISSHPEWNFVADLLAIPTCSGSDVCVGPFKISTDTSTGVPLTSVQISVRGTVNDATEGTSANFATTITGQFPGLTTPQVLALAQSSAGVFSNTISDATIITVASVPEPATVAFIGVGLIGLGLTRRRWSK